MIVVATRDAAKRSVVATAGWQSTAEHEPEEAKGSNYHSYMQMGTKAVESETKCLEQLANGTGYSDEKPIR